MSKPTPEFSLMKKIVIWVVLNFVVSFALAQVPVLGTYPASTIATAGGNTNVTPSTVPANVTSIAASASGNFKGVLQVNPATGVVSIINAHPAGTYTINLKAFNGTTAASTTFLLTVNNTTCSQGLLVGTNTVIADTYPTTVGIADFNGDAKQDIAVVNNYAGTVSIRLGDGTGGFTGTTNVTVGNSPYSIAINDFNGDGKADFVVANNNVNGTVSIRLGNGIGGFTGTTNVYIGNYCSFVRSGDFNGDGKADFAVTVSGSNSVAVRYGDGAGNFTGNTIVSVGTNPGSLVIADFNRDNYLDFATTNYGSNTVSVSLGDGTGYFSNAIDVAAGPNPNSITTDDFNGDGKPDLAFTNSGNNTVFIRLGDGAGSFTGTVSVSALFARSISTGDFNGDGRQDFITADYGNGNVAIRLGDGTGNFSSTALVSSVGANPQGLAVGDVNADGKQDVISANDSYTNTVYIRLGSSNEINVQGNGVSIADGDATPATADHTNFGNVNASLTRTYTIQNTGTGALTISNIIISGTDSSLFTRSGITLPATIAAGAVATFTVQFQPVATGVKTATVIITNNDCDEGMYDFSIQGTGVAIVPALGSYPATTIAAAGGNTTIAASSTPVNAAGITASADAGFKGRLQVNPATGLLTITNAHPAGNYTIVVRAYNGFSTVATTFSLTVNNSICSNVGGTVSVPVDYAPNTVLTGDFNNDGKQDFVTANSTGPGTLSIRLGNGAGGFTGSTNAVCGGYPVAIAIADVNGDGKTDFVIASDAGSNSVVMIRLGDGAGGFTGNTNVPVGASPYSVAIADFNDDGKPDFATANSGANSVSVRLGDGTGNFTGSTELAVGTNPRFVATGDFNNDGKQDLAVSNSANGSVSIRLGDGSGSFTAAADVAAGTGSGTIVVSDYNKDGNSDFAIPNYSGNAFSVCMGNGTGGFSTIISVPVSGSPQSLALGDFNGDGNTDFATVKNDNSVAIRWGNGAGNFATGTDVPVVNYARSIAVSDFNGDGKHDIVVACNSGSNSVVAVRMGSVNEINVQGNSTNIADGSTVAATGNHTDFGNAGNVSRTFAIQNTGLVALTVNSIVISGANASLFTTGGISLPASVPAGSAVTFTLNFFPTSTGLKTATITINNDDCDEASYDFAVQGNGLLPGLGTYAATTVAAGANTTLTPSALPANVTGISATAPSNFKGVLQVDTATGLLRVTNAQPAGIYTIIVKAFNGALAVSNNVTLTVNNVSCSQALFTGVTTVRVGARPRAIAIGDFNNDGKQDFATANYNDTTLSIRLGNGAGGFVGTTQVKTISVPVAVAVSDFNSDGNQDLIVGYENGTVVSVRFGNGAGAFTASAEINVGNSPRSITIGDFNNDGIPDFATANIATPASVSIRLGNGRGGFTGTTELAQGLRVTYVANGDFNSDGKQDVAVGNFATNAVHIYNGDGAGNFSASTIVSVGASPGIITTGDFNGDGKEDLLIGNSNGSAFVRFSNGTGGFTGTDSEPVDGIFYGLAVGDFNGDGKQDYAVPVYLGNNVLTRLNNGSGRFTGLYATNSTPVGSYPYAIAVGDFNSDGILDFVTTSSLDSNVSVRLGNLNEINVKGNNKTIADADAIPDTTDYTDFGNVSSSLIRTYLIQNTGSVNLVINNIAISGVDSSMFSLGGISLPVTLTPSDSTFFTVAFIPTTAGLKAAIVKISNDDCDEAIYDFAIQGTGIATTPVLGNYPVTVIATAGGNATVSPSAIPSDATNITAFTSSRFKGILQVNPTTGMVNITNAHPAGTYTITIKVQGIVPVTTTFTLTVGNPACSPATFSTPAGSVTMPSAYAITIADINGDGKQDYVTANFATNTISTYLGNGAGNFSAHTTITVARSPRAITAADFNGDGRMDIATTGYDNLVTISLGNGSGGFAGANTITVGDIPLTIAVADFNGDGKPDFVSGGNNKLTVRLGNGAGGFTGNAGISFGGNPKSIAIGDFNNDGVPDIAAALDFASRVYLLLGDGTGAFTQSSQVTVGDYPYAVATGDFNNDGNLDFATANNAANTVSVRLGNGAGGFSGTGSFAVGASPSAIATGDFNGDGKQDLLTGNAGSGTASILTGDGLGGFTAAPIVVTGTNPITVAVGDFNQDGKQDFAATNFGNNSTISIHLGSSNEINVQGNGSNIADGDTTVTLNNGTDFGSLVMGSTLTRNYTIQNTGTKSLSINQIYVAGADSLSFTITGITLPATIAAGASVTFKVRFVPVNSGIKTAMLTILNDDCDESVYNFAIQGSACITASADNVWLGNTADWDQANNWSLGTVPTGCIRVVVNNGTPFMPRVTDANSACYSLSLNNGATVTVKTGGHLNITANN